MARGTAAVVTLLLSALLVNLVLPHHGPALAAVTERTVERSESHTRDFEYDAPHSQGRTSASAPHHGCVLRGLGGRQHSAPSPRRQSVQVSTTVTESAEPDTSAGATHARTARSRHAPSAGQPPTPVVLQVFRC
ncbi:hypothetical protein ABZ860_03485 [Microbispora sp. NPDC046973]|uniref:hypothetical protein n=1 Tax=Microbispora sp. NPDC046973 TaxID=3155022 RepID=UPI0033FB790B